MLIQHLAAIAAAAANLDYRANLGKTRMFGGIAHSTGQFVVVDVRGLPAIVADQENAIMQAAGMLVGDIRVGAFDPASQVCAYEQVEDSINAIRRNPLPARLGNGLGDIIGAGGSFETGKRIKYGCAHIRPLLTALGHPPGRGIAERRTLMKLVSMC